MGSSCGGPGTVKKPNTAASTLSDLYFTMSIFISASDWRPLRVDTVSVSVDHFSQVRILATIWVISYLAESSVFFSFCSSVLSSGDNMNHVSTAFFWEYFSSYSCFGDTFLLNNNLILFKHSISECGLGVWGWFLPQKQRRKSQAKQTKPHKAFKSKGNNISHGEFSPESNTWKRMTIRKGRQPGEERS